MTKGSNLKVLLTGFGSFADVVSNPSARIVESLAESGVEGCELTTLTLPVSFERASIEIERILAERRFDLAILLGVAGNELEIRLESRARNLDAARIPDCDGFEPHGLIAQHGPDFHESLVELTPILAVLLDTGIQARISDNAGSYVCNRVYYAALNEIDRRSLATRCLFIHVPPDEDTFQTRTTAIGMPTERQLKAIQLALEVILATLESEQAASEESERPFTSPLC